MTNRVGLLYDDLTRSIIAAFLEVYNILGFGLLESVYGARIVDGKVVVELKAGVLLPPYSERQPCLSQGDTTRGWIAAPLRARA